jgi:glycosyltransferase involved in cell wall biosynthesis
MLLQTSIRLDPRVCGGVERVALAEQQGLARRGHQADLYVSALTGAGENVQVLPDAGPGHRLRQWAYYRRFLAQARGAEVLHGHYTPALATLAPRRTLVHLHGLSVAEIPLYRFLRGRAAQAHFACCARHIADKFANLYPGLPETHLHVLYNAADTELFHPGPTRPAGGPVQLTFHGLWEEPKGIFDLLAAVELLESKRQDFQLHLVGSALFEGDSPEARAAQRRVEEWAGRLRTVRLVGPLSHPQLAAHLQQMDVGVFPSNHEEPFGNVVVEMMAAGLPVVAYDLGGPREIILEGETGLLVENKHVRKLAAALETLLDNPELRARLGERGRQRVEQCFTWDRHVDQLLGIYEQIMRRDARES